MDFTFNAEDAKLIRKFEEIKNRGYYADGGQVTTLYNRVFKTNVNSTSCGSCLRGRIQQMVDALNRFEIKAQEALKDEEVNNDTQEENKPAVEPNNEADKADKNEVIEEKKRVGRPKKN